MNKSSRNAVLFCCASALFGAEGLGVFETSGDVGITPQKGKVEITAAGGYRVTGGGANIWGSEDAFYFVYKRISGDVALSADLYFEGVGAVPHRKAAVMIRQSLDAGSPYADVAVHGDGLTSLQYRPEAGAPTQEVRSDLTGSSHIRIERRGDRFTLYASKHGETKASAPVTVVLQDPVYIGLAVSSHDANVLETAVFSDVKIEALATQAAQPASRTRYRSKVSIYDLERKSTRVLYTADDVFEAPNWSGDGKFLLSNSGGKLYRLPVVGAAPTAPEPLNIDPAYRCNNDHGFSPDGKLLAISAASPSSRQSQVFLCAADGSNARLMVSKAPSYFHGWSPDGKWMAVVGQRDGNFDLFRVAASGGEEERLTSNPGYDDGPDYSPDGKWIYFNSDRSGSWDIWRMPADGAGPGDNKAEQVTNDELEDWFPHPSPDGKWLLFLSFPKGTSGHGGKLEVQLRMLPLPGAHVTKGAIQELTRFFGGQGTINVNSWSPDSKQFAFVVYEPLP